MPTLDEIRRTNLAKLIEEAGGNRQFAEVVGCSESQLSQWAQGAPDSKTGKRRGMRNETAQRLERAGKKSPGWINIDHSKPPQIEQSSTQPNSGLVDAVEILGNALALIPERTRRTVLLQLDGLVANPKEAREIGQEIQALIEAAKRRSA